ncbi:MAG: hypothetical protein MR406_03980 [Blautia sp.]|nr:hypothetical protein [Blautia sp.]MDY5665624.1 hypothetical protein [Blautia sp.]
MTAQELLDKLLDSYRQSFDITRPFQVDGHAYDAYAAFNVTSAKYVLVKTAELWRADCYEHTFFSCRETLSREDLDIFREEIVNYIEPEIVREGKTCMEKDHMYTYITGVFLCEQGVPKELKKDICRFRFFKNYRFGIRGYSEARLLVLDLKNHEILGNRAAKDLIKGYKKFF